MVTSLRRLLAAACALVTALACGEAWAHAVLLESSPAADAVLAQAPEQITLRFTEPVRPTAIRLLRAADGVDVELGAPAASDAELRTALPASLPEGAYVLSYRVISADGHPVVGSFIFAIGSLGSGAEAGLAAAGTADDGWRMAGLAARALWYAAMLLTAGLALFLALLPVAAGLAGSLRRGLGWLALAGLFAGIGMLGATGGALHGGAPGVLVTAEPWRIALASPVAASVAVAALGLGVLAAAAREAVRPARAVLLTGACLVALSFGVSGHAATAGPRWLTLPVLALHGLCAAWWVGAFAPLLLALRRLPGDQALVLLRAFSGRAVLAVVCLVLAGIVLSALQLRTPSALIATDYGRLLLLKIALIVALLGLAAVNRLILTPALERRSDAARWLRRTIGADLMLAAGVVGLTAGLGTVPPPRALAERATAHSHADHRTGEYATRVAAQGHDLLLVATPGKAGQNRIDLYLTDDQGRPVDAKAVEISFALPDRGIEALRFDAVRVGAGHFRSRATLPLPGGWQVSTDLLVDDFTKLPIRATIVVQE
jgi:copper transport protein